MFNEKLKEAFAKIKEDIAHLDQEITLMKAQISQIYDYLTQINESDTYQTETRHIIKNQTDIPSNIEELSLNSVSSIGNEGVPTDRQTDRQTPDRHPTDTLKRTSEVVLDLQEFQRKFKNVTQQEYLIFSALYVLSETKKQVSYRDISEKTKLTESSVRDYVGSLIRKGLPITKTKINNKQIVLSVPREFKDIATLDILSKIRSERY